MTSFLGVLIEFLEEVGSNSVICTKDEKRMVNLSKISTTKQFNTY